MQIWIGFCLVFAGSIRVVFIKTEYFNLLKLFYFIIIFFGWYFITDVMFEMTSKRRKEEK